MWNKGFCSYFVIILCLISLQSNSSGSISDEHSPFNYITSADSYKDYNTTHNVKKMGSWLSNSGGGSGSTESYPKNNLYYSMYIYNNTNIHLTTHEFDWSEIPSYIEFNGTNNNFELIVNFLRNHNDDLFVFSCYDDSGYSSSSLYESEYLSSFDLLSNYSIASIAIDLSKLILTVTDNSSPDYDYYYEFSYNIYYEIWVFVINDSTPIVSNNVTIEESLTVATPEFELPVYFNIIPLTIIFVGLISKANSRQQRRKKYFMIKDI